MCGRAAGRRGAAPCVPARAQPWWIASGGHHSRSSTWAQSSHPTTLLRSPPRFESPRSPAMGLGGGADRKVPGGSWKESVPARRS
eukprot:4210467-Prymnesium_polylepis.1